METFKVGDRVVDAETHQAGRVIKIYTVSPTEHAETNERLVYLIEWDDDGTTTVSEGLEHEPSG
jgi:hypothetical protein